MRMPKSLEFVRADNRVFLTHSIALITISHRPSLLKYHSLLLTLTGERGQWELSNLKDASGEGASANNRKSMDIEQEIRSLKKQLSEVPALQKRLQEVKVALNLA